MNEVSCELLKLDALGRVRTTRQRREALLDEFERSGVAAAQFARMAGIKYPTFATWVQQRRRATGAYEPMAMTGPATTSKGRAALPGPRFVEAQLGGSAPGPGSGRALRVELPGGARMEIADDSQAAMAAALLRALAAGGAGC